MVNLKFVSGLLEIMEELLQDIFKESAGPKLSALKKSAQDALGTYFDGLLCS